MLSCTGLSARAKPGEGEALNGEANERERKGGWNKREKEERKKKRERENEET